MAVAPSLRVRVGVPPDRLTLTASLIASEMGTTIPAPAVLSVVAAKPTNGAKLNASASQAGAGPLQSGCNWGWMAAGNRSDDAPDSARHA